MQRVSFEEMNCSVAQCLEVVGEWWSLLILRDCFMGVRRFDDFQRRLGISRNILNQRLTSLVDHGVLDRVPYQERPTRHEYRLTDKGRDLWAVVTAMREWGDRWAAPDGAPVEIVHRSAGTSPTSSPCARHCGERIDLHSVAPRSDGAAPAGFAGPGSTPTARAGPADVARRLMHHQ